MSFRNWTASFTPFISNDEEGPLLCPSGDVERGCGREFFHFPKPSTRIGGVVFTCLVVDIVLSVVKCVSMSQGKGGQEGTRFGGAVQGLGKGA